MTKAEFDKLFEGVAGKEHAGAKYPPFNPNAINESRIEHECRYKMYDCDFNEAKNYVGIKWMTQDDCTEHSLLIEEVLRCFREALKFDGDIFLDICSRDEPDYFMSYHF